MRLSAGRPSRTWLVKTARLMTSVAPEERDPKCRNQLACGALQSAARLLDPRPGWSTWFRGRHTQACVQGTDQRRPKRIDPLLIRAKDGLPLGNLGVLRFIELAVQVALSGEHVDLPITQSPIGQATQGAATLAAEETGHRDPNQFQTPGNPALIRSMSKKSLGVIAVRAVSGVGDLVLVIRFNVFRNADGNRHDLLHPVTLQTQRLPKSR